MTVKHKRYGITNCICVVEYRNMFIIVTQNPYQNQHITILFGELWYKTKHNMYGIKNGTCIKIY